MQLYLIFFLSYVVNNVFSNLFDDDGIKNYPFIPTSVNFSNIHSECSKDMKTWMQSIEIIGKTSTECLLFKNCSAPVEKLLKENLYAIQQYDAFGKIPSPGLFEVSLIFDGSAQECQRISGVKYQTNYCYVILVPGKNASCSGASIQNAGSSIAFRRAVCMPRSCDSMDTVNLYNQLSMLPLTACAVFCSHRDIPKDSAFWGFSVNPQPATHIKCLDCIRGLSMAWVLSGHMLNYFAFSDTLMPIKSFSDYFADYFFMNAVFSVDTFFLVSGITLAYSFFRINPTRKTIRSPATWILYYVHRYVRLTPPYMIFIGFYTVYALYIQGPLAASLFNFTVPQVEACKSSWWRNLIYINNFDNGENPCYGPSWYLAVDTQLYLVAPIILIALVWKPLSGLLVALIGCIGSMITVFVLYQKYDMPADSFNSDPSGKFNFYVYQKPWIRCPPYLIGIIGGYFLVKVQRPFKIPMILKMLGMILAVGIAFACLTANMGYDQGDHWSSWVKAIYYNFSRLLWSISVLWIILSCHFDWAGPIGNFMNHPIWQPLGRLSYSAYIVHLMVVYYFLNVGAKPLHFVSTWQVYVYYILPATILTYTFAFFWSCLFELPIVKLEKLLLDLLLKKEAPEKKDTKSEIWK